MKKALYSTFLGDKSLDLNSEPIVFFQMGMIGAYSLSLELSQKMNDEKIYHIQNLSKESVAKKENDTNIPFEIEKSLLAKLKEDKKKQWKFVCVIDDPYSTVSFAFKNSYKDILANVIDNKDELYNDFLTFSNMYNYSYDYFSLWFDTEVKPTLGIDIFKEEFDKEAGYKIYKNKNIELLVIKSTSLNFAKAINEFLNVEIDKSQLWDLSFDFDLDRNQKEFFKSISLDRLELDKSLKAKFAQHFYSKEDISELYEKWGIPEIRTDKMIMDVGMHIAQDTSFYLKKGFDVISIEANPLLAKAGEEKLADYIERGQLRILNIGVGKENGVFPFYVNDTYSEWSSFVEEIGTREGKYHEIQIECKPLADVFREYGVPYYVKIDIEGHDMVAAEAIREMKVKPRYISVENGFKEFLDLFREQGYDKFKFINQAEVPNQKEPNPAKEGIYTGHKFEYGASGLFGEDLPGEWLDYDAVLKQVEAYWSIPNRDAVVHGWYDLHAKHSKF